MLETVAEIGAGNFCFLSEPFGKGFGAMEGENRAAAGVWFDEVGEAGFDAGALVAEGERLARGLELGREADAVFFGLDFVAGEGGAFFFGFDDTGGDGVERRGDSRPRRSRISGEIRGWRRRGRR